MKASEYTYTASRLVCPHCEKDYPGIPKDFPATHTVTLKCPVCQKEFTATVSYFTTSTDVEEVSDEKAI